MSQKLIKIYAHTGRVICPASSIIQKSNFLFASKGWLIPKQVTPTTRTCSILCLISLTLLISVATIRKRDKQNISQKNEEDIQKQNKQKERIFHLTNNAPWYHHEQLHACLYVQNLCPVKGMIRGCRMVEIQLLQKSI